MEKGVSKRMNQCPINTPLKSPLDNCWFLRIALLLGFGLLTSKNVIGQGRRNSSVGNASDLVTHRWAAHHCVGGSNPNACERSLASHAVYTLIQCTPLLVEKAGVTPVVTFRITARKQERVQARYPLWIWNPWGRTHEVQNRSNQWLHKMDLGSKKKFKMLLVSRSKFQNEWISGLCAKAWLQIRSMHE